MTRKLLLVAFLVTLGLTGIAMHHQLTNAAPDMAPPPRQAPSLDQYAAHLDSVTPTWQVVAGGGGKDRTLYDIDMVSPAEGWAVGNSGPGSYGVLLHYTNSVWSRVSPLTGTYSIRAVSMLSPTEGWAAGYASCLYGFDHDLLLHYAANTGWQTATVPASLGPDHRRGFYGLDIKGTAGWAVGGYGFDSGYNNYFFQLDGTSWTPITVSMDSAMGVSVIDVGEAWAVGGRYLAHYSNGKWLATSSGQPADTYLQDVHMLNANEGWAVGYTRVGGSLVVYQCVMRHYTGGAWVSVPCSGSSRLSSVWMRNSNDVWAVGLEGTAFHYDGLAWSPVIVPAGTSSLHSVRLVGADDGWIVGSAGTILRLVDGNWTRVSGSDLSIGLLDSVGGPEAWYGGANGELIRWRNGITTAYSSGVLAPIRVLDMVSPTVGWAFARSGDSRYILKYSDIGWTIIPTTTNVTAISMVGPEEGWFRTGLGLLHYNSGVWQSESGPSPFTINSISMLDANHGWASSDYDYGLGASRARVYTYTGGTWNEVIPTQIVTGNYGSLKIIGISPDEAWLAGWTEVCTAVACPVYPQLHHFSGGGWTSVALPDWLALYDLSKVSATEWWAAGKLSTMEYAFLHYKEGAYTIVPAAGEDVLGVSMLPDGTGFARGVGSLLQLTDGTVAPGGVSISGPTTGLIGTANAFTSTVSPVTTTLPITHVWQATGQSPVSNTGGLSNTVAFTWESPGIQFITVTAANGAGSVTGYHAITVTRPQIAGVSLTANQNGTVYPAQSVIYQHTLTNTGTGTDSFTMTASMDRPGWLVVAAPPVVGPLNAGVTAGVVVTVTAPGGITATVTATARITATSQFDADVTSAVMDVTTAWPYQVYLPIVIRQ